MNSKRRDLVILFLPKSLARSGFLSELPYSLLYLERALRNLSIEVVLIDESRQPNYLPLLAENGKRILLAGVSAMTGYQISGGLAFSRSVRAICQAPVVWGGCHPTLLPEETLREDCIDYVVVGQGERPLRRLIECLRSGSEPSDIPGLGRKRGDSVEVNPSGMPESYEAFPPVNFDAVDLKAYVMEESGNIKRCLPYFASHGCPFHCSFCSVGMIYKRRWCPKQIPRIIQELRYLKQHADIDGVQFYDENLLVNVDFSREFARAMIDAKLGLKWRCGAHAHVFTQKFNDEDVKLLEQSGCSRIYIGAETGDQETLDLLAKESKVEDTYRFIDMLKPHGIIPRLSTMVCLPFRPDCDFDATMDMIKRAKLMEPRLEATMSFYTPYPGTDLYALAIEKGFVPPRNLTEWSKHTFFEFNAPWTPKRCRRQHSRFMDFYFPMLDRPNYLQGRGRALRILARPINRSLNRLAWLRLRNNCFVFPIEASIFLGLRNRYSQLRSRWITPAS